MALRAVPDNEEPREPPSVLRAATHGTHRDLLVAMRDTVAEAVGSPDTSPRDLAALTRRLQDIAEKLEAIDAAAREVATHVDVDDGDFNAKAV